MKINFPKSTQYPRKIFICNEYYMIKFVKHLKDYGDCDSEKKRIRIKAGMSDRETFLTFIHECIHALEFEHDIKIKHAEVYKLERALFELLFDNFM